MRLAALFSGGKDSAYSVYEAQNRGHHISCLVTVSPVSPDSMLLHHPNAHITKIQAASMGIAHLYARSPSDMAMELATLHSLLDEAKTMYHIQGVVHGGILSRFQLNAFEKMCGRLGLQLVSPIWQRDQSEYMRALLEAGFRFIICAVASGGLDHSWLGREVTMENLRTLEGLSERFGFNLCFEGGEAETLVVDCPLFSSAICVKGTPHWDGYRGSFEIEEATLQSDARRTPG